MNHYIHNGNIFTEDFKKISVYNPNFQSNEGVFETMKSKNGKILFFNEHFGRLKMGLKVLKFEIGESFSKQKLEKEILALIQLNGHHELARIRLTFYRTNRDLQLSLNNIPDYTIHSWSLTPEISLWNNTGLNIGIYHDVKKSINKLSNLKHNNYLPGIKGATFAKDQSLDDVILLNDKNSICESTIANVFIIKNGIVFTPSLLEGCVAGVMRKFIMQHLSMQNQKIIEKEISVDELLDADEIFLTNAIRNIKWVKTIGHKSYANELTLEIYKSIQTFLS